MHILPVYFAGPAKRPVKSAASVVATAPTEPVKLNKAVGDNPAIPRMIVSAGIEGYALNEHFVEEAHAVMNRALGKLGHPTIETRVFAHRYESGNCYRLFVTFWDTKADTPVADLEQVKTLSQLAKRALMEIQYEVKTTSLPQ